MSAQYPSSPPATSGTLERVRLLEALASPLSRIGLLLAPSGYGKTVVASQYAAGFDRVQWLNCSGGPPDITLVVAAALKLLGTPVPAGEPLAPDDLTRVLLAESDRAPQATSGLLVIDDAGISSETSGELWFVCRVLAQSGVSVLVTARSALTELPELLHDVCIMGTEELRLTGEEAVELASCAHGLEAQEALVELMWQETQGHIALFSVMSHAARHRLAIGGRDGRAAAWIDRIVRTQLSHSDNDALIAVGLLKHGTASELGAVGVDDAASALARCARALPLVRLVSGSESGPASQLRFSAHDIVCEYILQQALQGLPEAKVVGGRILRLLQERGDLMQAAEILPLLDDATKEKFIAEQGMRCVIAGGADALLRAIESLPVARMMSSPALMLTWSEALLEAGDYSDAHAKSKAARVLADHQGDTQASAHALANSLTALRLSNRWGDSHDLLQEARTLVLEMSATGTAYALQRSAGSSMLLLGQYAEAESMLNDAREAALRSGAQAVVVEADNVLALIPCMRYGNFVASLRALTVLVATSSNRTSQGLDCRGNMVVGLVETGRVARARGLLQPVLAAACDAARSSFLPCQAAILITAGKDEEALEAAGSAVALALAHGAQIVASQNRVYESMMLRAAGRSDDALISAERAYESLGSRGTLDFRRLSVLEISASMLALGDVAAASAWLEPQLAEGFGENEHHRYRARMIQAEIARRQGDIPGAIGILRDGSDHLLSENSNFQAAMYARAFPHLLGLMAASVGSSELPMHLLKMIPAEVGEGLLQASREVLDGREWEVLGQRLLGHAQFRDFVAREGSPLCRVRLFGGLEVSVGERKVREKDWRKRKARLLFAILVLERGRQVSREQLLAHVWPDLTEDRAKNNFYVAWSNMKSALSTGQEPFLYAENTGGLCSIVRDAVRSDVDEFEECIIAGREAEASGDVAGAISAYQQLAAVYRGELLPGDLYDDWFMPMRERYRMDFIASMLRLVDLLMEADDPCEAAVYARRALGVDQYREDLYQALIRCQIAAGQRSAAIESFITCKTQIAEQLGLDPSPETTALYQEILCMEDKPRYDDLGLNSDRY